MEPNTPLDAQAAHDLLLPNLQNMERYRVRLLRRHLQDRHATQSPARTSFRPVQ